MLCRVAPHHPGREASPPDAGVCLSLLPTHNKQACCHDNQSTGEWSYIQEKCCTDWSFTHSQSVTLTGILIFKNILFSTTHNHSFRGTQLTYTKEQWKQKDKKTETQICGYKVKELWVNMLVFVCFSVCVDFRKNMKAQSRQCKSTLSILGLSNLLRTTSNHLEQLRIWPSSLNPPFLQRKWREEEEKKEARWGDAESAGEKLSWLPAKRKQRGGGHRRGGEQETAGLRRLAQVC